MMTQPIKKLSAQHRHLVHEQDVALAHAPLHLDRRVPEPLMNRLTHSQSTKRVYGRSSDRFRGDSRRRRRHRPPPRARRRRSNRAQHPRLPRPPHPRHERVLPSQRRLHALTLSLIQRLQRFRALIRLRRRHGERRERIHQTFHLARARADDLLPLPRAHLSRVSARRRTESRDVSRDASRARSRRVASRTARRRRRRRRSQSSIE